MPWLKRSLFLCSSGLLLRQASVKMKKMQQEGRPGTSTRNSLSMWQPRWKGGHRFIDDLVQDTIANEDELHQAVSSSED